MKIFRFVAVACSVCYALSGQTSTLIRNAQIIDGTGQPARKGSVRIIGDRISAVGELRALPGDKIVEAEGLVLSPGFIDLHNHTFYLGRDRRAESQIAQGITTILLGQDGGSALPIAPYLAARRLRPPTLNVLTLVGHETVREQVMGDNFQRPAKPAEIRRMALLVEQAMREGAQGLSSGLEYDIGSYGSTEEVIALAKAASKYGGIYVTHVRDEGNKVVEAIREAIHIGQEARIPVQLSHIKLASASVWGKADEIIAIVDEARMRGLDVTADCYPYDAWSSTITVLVPNKRHDHEPSVAKALADVGGAANITIARCWEHPEYETRTLEQLAADLKMTPEAVYSHIVKDGGAVVVCKAMIREDIRRFYEQPWVMVASDGGVDMKHPRAAGTFPRVLGEYVRERKWLSLEDAVHKMTAEPAARIGLVDRGTIRQGAFADLVLFDPAKVRDQATFEDPYKLATGIDKVFVNGGLVWSGGKLTGRYPGRVPKTQRRVVKPSTEPRPTTETSE